jgi:recombinational DNA repair protein RecR
MSRKHWLVFCASLTLLPAAASSAPPASDNRAVIIVSEAERSLLMEEMRDFLHGLHSIQLALARKDMNGVALSAKDIGTLLQRMPSAMRERVPETFMQLGMGQREVFEVIARDAVAKNDIHHTLGQVAEALTYCSGCHDTYRVVVGRTGKSAR